MSDVWLNTISGVSVRGFQNEINIVSVDWAKLFDLPDVGGPHPICFRPNYNERLNRKIIFFFVCFQVDSLPFSCLQTQTITETDTTALPGYQTFGYSLKLYIGSPGPPAC